MLSAEGKEHELKEGYIYFVAPGVPLKYQAFWALDVIALYLA